MPTHMQSPRLSEQKMITASMSSTQNVFLPTSKKSDKLALSSSKTGSGSKSLINNNFAQNLNKLLQSKRNESKEAMHTFDKIVSNKNLLQKKPDISHKYRNEVSSSFFFKQKTDFSVKVHR